MYNCYNLPDFNVKFGHSIGIIGGDARESLPKIGICYSVEITEKTLQGIWELTIFYDKKDLNKIITYCYKKDILNKTKYIILLYPDEKQILIDLIENYENLKSFNFSEIIYKNVIDKI
jgi:hypothetical protein